MPSAAFLLSAFGAATLLSGCAINLDAEKITHVDEHRFSVTGPPSLELTTFDGAIRVDAWDEAGVLVTVKKRAEDLETARALPTTVRQDGDRIVVEAPQPERRRSFGVNVGRSVSLEVMVPRRADIQARTGDGSIAVTGIEGQVALRSGDGAIRGSRVQGDVTASTGDGSITLEEAHGSIDLHSGDGSISAEGTFERVKVRTGDGSVRVQAGPGTRVAGDWEITSGDGSITLELPGALDAELEARTGDGRVSVEGFTLQDATQSERNLKARVGAGGPALRIRTGDGSISLRGR